jgi:hypothetical protein
MNAPDADENVDEQFHGRGHTDDPAWLISDAFGGVLRENQRFRNSPGRHRGAVGLPREPDPGGGDQWFVRKIGLRNRSIDALTQFY